jgi:multimeric flavodoxin WrbA
LNIRGNTHYGGFGDAFGPIKYDGNTIFLDDPDAVIENDYVAFASAIYFYMTPSVFKPSMHDIMTGFWDPNATDEGMKIYPGFGATNAIINGEEECN